MNVQRFPAEENQSWKDLIHNAPAFKGASLVQRPELFSESRALGL